MEAEAGFGCLPESFCSQGESRIVVVPVAYDGTSTWVKGADKGPEAIIEASANMELYDIETDSEVYREGIFTDDFIEGGSGPKVMAEAIAGTVEYHLERDKFVVVIGGEHSVSIGSVRAHAQKYQNLTVLQLDAHGDLRDEYNGSKYNHACVMARVKELCPIVQVGIRSMDISERDAVGRSNVFFAEDICHNNGWVETAVSRLSENVYITIDLDVFDPSIMPSTGTPEPGGLLWYDVLNLLRKVCESKCVVGFDIVELCPNKYDKTSDFLAAKLIYKILSYKFGSRK